MEMVDNHHKINSHSRHQVKPHRKIPAIFNCILWIKAVELISFPPLSLDITPNGSLRRRRSRIPSEEDESGLMDFLRSSGSSSDGLQAKRGTEQYGSLDRSWSRKTRRRPNLMDFVNDERERPVSPAPPHPEFKGPGNPNRTENPDAKPPGTDPKIDGDRKSKNESPVR